MHSLWPVIAVNVFVKAIPQTDFFPLYGIHLNAKIQFPIFLISILWN